jgi:hypothetical protein
LCFYFSIFHNGMKGTTLLLVLLWIVFWNILLRQLWIWICLWTVWKWILAVGCHGRYCLIDDFLLEEWQFWFKRVARQSRQWILHAPQKTCLFKWTLWEQSVLCCPSLMEIN